MKTHTPMTFSLARRSSLPGFVVFLLAAICVVSRPLPAAPPRISTSVEPAEVRPGGYVTYSITIESGSLQTAPTLNLPPGLDLASPSPSVRQQTSINNGVMRQSATLSWEISCSQLGEFTIPPQDIEISEQPMKTEAVTVTVKDNPAYPVSRNEPMMTLEVGKREFYLGEVIPITVNLYVHRETLLRRVGLIELPKDNFAIQRFPLQGEEGMITMGGVPYRTLAFNSTLSALKAGKYKLGPASSEIIVEVPKEGGRMLHPFFNETETRKMRPQCNDIEITVLPLPSEGVPKGFTHLVGDFDVSITAEPRDVSVNDPISVEMTVRGTGNFDALTVPTITDPDSWKVYPARRFNVQSSDNPADGSSRSIGFSQVILPKKKVSAVPSFEFSFFSPTKKQYVTLRTEPIPINVKALAQPIETPAKASAGTSSTKQAEPEVDDKVPTVQPKITDILANVPAQSAWVTARPALWADKRFLNANIMAAFVLALIILGKAGFTAWQVYSNSPKAPLRKLWSQLQEPHQSRAKFYTLAASYISARGLSGDAIQSILARHHAVNYSRTSVEGSEQIPHEERIIVLKALEARTISSGGVPQQAPA